MRLQGSMVSGPPSRSQVADQGGYPETSVVVILVLCVCLYNTLYICFDLLGAKSWADGDHIEPAVVVLLTEVGKFSVSLCLFGINKNWPWAEESAPLLAEQQATWTSEDVKITFRNLMLPACCYSTIDVLNLQGLAYVSLAHYAALNQTGVFFTALASLLLIPTFRLNTQKVVGMLLLFVGGVMNAVGDNWQLDEDVPTFAGTRIVVSAAMMSSFGSVLNERVVKSCMSMDDNLQNMLLYSQTTSLLAIYVFCSHAVTQSWHEVWMSLNRTVGCLICFKIGLGLAVSRMLKYGGSMLKQFAAALHIPIEVFVAHLVLQTYMGVSTMLGAVFIGVATFIYFTRLEVLDSPLARLRASLNWSASPRQHCTERHDAQA